jgi:iron complex outermembrane receptor protein
MIDAGKVRRALLTGAACLSLAPQALAQTDGRNEDPGGSDAQGDEIVVTGTLLRGISPPGSQTVAVGREDALATGATSTAQLLANIPQVADFNARPATRGQLASVNTVNHPDLRNLGSAVISGGGSATLLLLDGHRLPGMGVRQTIPDSDVIPPGAIERVEIVPDGGSAIYGADAVGGVVNYITRKRFDGVEARATYGFAPDYQSASVDLTVGKDWDSGSLWAAYSYNWHDKIYARDRDYAQNLDWRQGVPLDLTCTPGNAIITSATGVTSIYALPALTPGIGNRCDNSEDSTIYPNEERHSVLVGLTQQLADGIELQSKAFYTRRLNVSDGGPLTATAVIAPTSPFYRSTGDANAGRNQTININLNPVLTSSSDQIVKLETWGISHDLTAELGGGWRIRGLFNYGYGDSFTEYGVTNNTAFQGAVNAGAVNAGTINPYDIAAPGNAAALKAVTDWSFFGEGRHELIQYRAIADGPLFTLPGGDVSVAIGAEYMVEDYKVLSGVGTRSNHHDRPPGKDHRNTKAAFGELFVPVFGEGNRVPGFHSLAISAAGRYDDYSDFGGTFNPKLAVTWEPVSWAKLRANWSKSFQAPSLADGAESGATVITLLARVITPSPNPALQPTPGQVSIFVSGGGADLDPQKADIWSAGGDIEPPFIPGLALSGTYYNIKFKDLIAIPPVTSQLLYTAYSDYIQLGKPTPLTTQQLQAFAALAPGNNSQVIPYFSRPQDVYILIDARKANFAAVTTSGLDFSARYDRNTSFGSVYARFGGNYVLSRKESPVAGQPFVDTVDTFPRLRLSGTLGTTIGGFRGQVTWLHSGGFDVIPTVTNLQQARVADYDTFNLFFQYEFDGEGVLSDLALTLNVDNVFDQDPPLYRGSFPNAGGNGFANGFTLGRFVQFGIQKRF